jgi:hypothetical protein
MFTGWKAGVAMYSSEGVCDLGTILFAETRVRALPAKVMTKALQDRLPAELRARFPDLGVVAQYGPRTVEPFSVVDTSRPHDNETALMVFMHVGVNPDPTYRNQHEFDSKPAADVIRGFAAKRGWILHSVRNMADYSPQHFQLKLMMMPDKAHQPDHVPVYLYHITDVQNVSRIKREGLKPMAKVSKGRNYPGRVYVFLRRELMEEMLEFNAEAHSGGEGHQKLTKTPHVAVLTIDSEKLRPNTKFFVDPEFDGNPDAVYTYTHIPPEAITFADVMS